jgi:sporulation integral membrane protein YlbJ
MRPFFNVPGSGSFALAMGVTSGYPVGAKITCDMRNNGLLTKTEAERLLTFTNNSGPLFIIGAVGTGMLGSAQLGIFLFLCHFASCLTVGFLFRFYGLRDTKNRQINKNMNNSFIPHMRKGLLGEAKQRLLDEYANKSSSFGTILGDSIKNSISTITQIGGFVVLFSVIIQIFTQTGLISILSEGASVVLSHIGIDANILRGVFSGVLEITTGSRLISSSAGTALLLKLPAISFIIGWAGLSVHFQVMSIAAKTDINIRPYLCGKFLQGIFSAIYTWLGLRIFEGKLFYAANVLGAFDPDIRQFFRTLTSSSLILCCTLLFVILFSIIGSGQNSKHSLKSN